MHAQNNVLLGSSDESDSISTAVYEVMHSTSVCIIYSHAMYLHRQYRDHFHC